MMPESATLDRAAQSANLDLAAEDVSQAAWDELMERMAGESLPYELNMSSCYCTGCLCNTALHP
jgi:hypothetical protein